MLRSQPSDDVSCHASCLPQPRAQPSVPTYKPWTTRASSRPPNLTDSDPRRWDSTSRSIAWYQQTPIGPDSASNGRRQVTRWLPIFGWTEVEVWQTIARSAVPYHPAYAAGMPRLSCVFCVLAGRNELVLAAKLNPALAQDYARLEARIGHTFKADLSMADIVAEAAADTA